MARQIERAAAAATAAVGMPSLESAAASAAVALRAMVVGIDQAPRALHSEEIEALGDPFTRNLLLRGVVPLTLAQLEVAISTLQDEHARPMRKVYAIAEGAAFQRTNPRLPLNARLVITWQRDLTTDPDLLLSTTADPDGPAALLQLIAWSESQGAYQFFERLGGSWVWAGSSWNALQPGSRGNGPFDSHINGGLVMKELKFPWVHWHSQSRSIDRAILFPGTALAAHPLFTNLEGAQVLEAVVQRGVRRWTQRRIQRDLQAGRLANLKWYARQILWTTSVNLVSSETLAQEVPFVEDLALPSSFFLDIDGLLIAASGLGLEAGDLLPTTDFSVASTAYLAALAQLGMHVEADEGGPAVAGDTDFAFVVPERAFEDIVVLEQLIASQVLSARLALCLLMVDFSNPVFSPDRANLLPLFPDHIDAGDHGAALDAAVIGAARNKQVDVAGQRLLALWDDADLVATARNELKAFSQAVQASLRSSSGARTVLTLADSRREAFRQRSLNEFRHTLAVSGATVAHLALDASANVVQKASSLGEKEF